MQDLYREMARTGGDLSQADPAKFRVLNMLNTRYFIFPGGENGQTVPLQNPHASGNAWFVDDVLYVDNANAEIDALDSIHPARTAVVDRRFRDILHGATQMPHDSLASIRLTEYAPNRLVYTTDNAADGVAVFSEIYYPDGWQTTIDGQPASLARADYVLRALHIPAGRHTIEMRFDPTSLHVTEGIAYTAAVLILLGLVAALLLAWRNARRTDNAPTAPQA